MRKGILVVVLALVLSLTVTAVAFAHSNGYTYFDNGNSGWVSNGHHGHYWSGDFGGRVVIDDEDFDWYRHHDCDGKWHYCYDDNGNIHRCFNHGDCKDGEWYYYKDENGKTHYYYDDGDGEWNYHSYVDEYGNTQYSRTKIERIS